MSERDAKYLFPLPNVSQYTDKNHGDSCDENLRLQIEARHCQETKRKK